MITGNLIRQAQESGIELRLVDGKVKAIGPREAVLRLIEPLRQHREALTHALQFELQGVLPANPSSAEMHEPTDWHALDAAYLVHHFKCPACIAAGHGKRYGQRCGAGIALWRAYGE